ncbi:hypothetical protein AB0I55_22340 [Actinocatenispora sera]|uniref:hypothetical protein n=1 Tax=Actinocatenispora sera TaxID=390989 RepID=UPI0033C32CDB
MTYLAIFEDRDRGIPRARLVAALKEDWPEAVITDQESQEVRRVVWEYSESGHDLEGYLHADGTCIYLDSGLELAAKFALWFRELVPNDIELLFCDDSYSFNGVIEHGMSVQEVMAIADA